MSSDIKSKTTPLIAFVIVSFAIAGYFTGLQAPMKASSTESSLIVHGTENGRSGMTEAGVIPATHYANMSQATLSNRQQVQLTTFKSTVDPLAEIIIKPEDKLAALLKREQNRAFNGAPPTIPHPIDQRTDASCVACHTHGAKTASLRIPKMSHHFLANCTQCHIEKNSQQFTPVVFRESDFNGLQAPTSGPRAFQGAPPQIPHSTWMRTDCMSCHGETGQYGIRTTHPWRSNCQQCHAPSATMDQSLLATQPQFLPGPLIKDVDPVIKE